MGFSDAEGNVKPIDVTYTAKQSDNRMMNRNDKNTNFAQIMQRLLERNMLVPGSSMDADVRAEYRRIKRPLLSNAFGKSASLVDQGNLIMVTSSVPGEGKTYTAVNLALAFAQERDSTVLLVDCDVTKQGVSRMLGIEQIPAEFNGPAGQ